MGKVASKSNKLIERISGCDWIIQARWVRVFEDPFSDLNLAYWQHSMHLLAGLLDLNHHRV